VDVKGENQVVGFSCSSVPPGFLRAADDSVLRTDDRRRYTLQKWSKNVEFSRKNWSVTTISIDIGFSPGNQVGMNGSSRLLIELIIVRFLAPQCLQAFCGQRTTQCCGLMTGAGTPSKNGARMWEGGRWNVGGWEIFSFSLGASRGSET
jgi:hypothetical protein